MSVTFERTVPGDDEVFVFAVFNELPQRMYSSLAWMINERNIREFKQRPSANRVGLYDVTVGMAARRIHSEDPILGEPKIAPAFELAEIEAKEPAWSRRRSLNS